MERVNRKLGDTYNQKIKIFKCDDTIQLFSDKNKVIQPKTINNDRIIYNIYFNDGIKNLKISGEWEYAELTCGGCTIERIYPEIRDTFTSTLNGIPPTQFHQRHINVKSKSPNTLCISYDTIIRNDKYGHSVNSFQIYDCRKDSFNITSNTSININNYLTLPTTMMAVKIPYKCKRVFITWSYHNSYEYPAEIIPFIYNKTNDMWILDTKNSPFLGYYDNIHLYIITKTSQTSIIDLFVENINIGSHMSGMYGVKFAY